MKYHLDLFTPETWAAFREAGATVTGFRDRYRRLANERVELAPIHRKDEGGGGLSG